MTVVKLISYLDVMWTAAVITLVFKVLLPNLRGILGNLGDEAVGVGVADDLDLVAGTDGGFSLEEGNLGRLKSASLQSCESSVYCAYY